MNTDFAHLSYEIIAIYVAHTLKHGLYTYIYITPAVNPTFVYKITKQNY